MCLSSPDQIALPDFNAGAMENWGLVTYRETALLYDPIMSSTGNKERVTTVISHELAHMVGHEISPKALSSHMIFIGCKLNLSCVFLLSSDECCIHKFSQTTQPPFAITDDR